MDEDDALELLGRVAGPSRAAAEPDAAREIVRLCGYLPLAVRISGAKLKAKTRWSLARLATQLADERIRLSELALEDLGVRTSFASSYVGLPSDVRRSFRLLGLLPGPDFSSGPLAAQMECEPAYAEQLLEQLAQS